MTKRENERERQTQKDTMKPSAPQKVLLRRRVKQKQAQRDKQSNESLENFEKDDTFLSFAERTPAYQSNVQHNAEAWVIFFFFCSSCSCTGNHMAHKSCGRFFISTTHAPVPYAFKRETICFSRGPWKKSFDAIHEEGRKISLKLPPFGR